MVAFSSTLARPRYRSRASAGSVPFVRATLQLASLGTTSVSANVSLQRSLAGRIPNIAFSNIAAPPSTQRARVSDRLNIGNANPQSFGSPANLEAFGKDIGERLSNPFEQSRKVGIGEFENPNLSITAPKPTVSTAQSITLPAALGI
jgi:hypothetical protein